MNDDALADRRRPSEDDYFRKHDDQLIEEARQRAERDAARQRMSERVGTAANALLRTSDGDRARPLHPEVARTLHRDCRCLRRDARFGKICSSEREVLDHIRDVLEQTPHIRDNSPSYTLQGHWLDDQCRRLIAGIRTGWRDR